VKKVTLYGFAASILMLPVAASAVESNAATALTTKKYVDDGLTYVYGVAKDAQDRVGVLESVVGDGTNIGTMATTVSNLDEIVNGDSEDPNDTGLVGDVADLQEVINGDSSDPTDTGLVGDVADLQETINGDSSDPNDTGLVGRVTALEGNNIADYTGTNGVTVDTTNKQVKLNGTFNTTDSYVYRNGTWVPLEIESTWSPTFLTNPSSGSGGSGSGS